MNPTGADEVTEVLERVKHWPTPSRITLARRILESLDPSAESAIRAESPTRGVLADSIVGFLRIDRDPPDDEECRRIVEEERWKKYGP